MFAFRVVMTFLNILTMIAIFGTDMKDKKTLTGALVFELLFFLNTFLIWR